MEKIRRVTRSRRQPILIRRSALAAVVAGFVISSSVAFGASVNKCVEANGKVSYQDAPCHPQSTPQNIVIPRTSASAGIPAINLIGIEAVNTASSLAPLVERCSKFVPGFGKKYDTAAAAWLSAHGDALRLAETMPAQSEGMRLQREFTRNAKLGKEDIEELAEICGRVARGYLGGGYGTTGTPMDTWNGMIKALESGDVEAAIEFFSRSAKYSHRQFFTALIASGKLAQVLAEMRQLHDLEQTESDVARGTLRVGDRVGNVVFVQSNGRWYIESTG